MNWSLFNWTEVPLWEFNVFFFFLFLLTFLGICPREAGIFLWNAILTYTHTQKLLLLPSKIKVLIRSLTILLLGRLEGSSGILDTASWSITTYVFSYIWRHSKETWAKSIAFELVGLSSNDSVTADWAWILAKLLTFWLSTVFTSAEWVHK